MRHLRPAAIAAILTASPLFLNAGTVTLARLQGELIDRFAPGSSIDPWTVPAVPLYNMVEVETEGSPGQVTPDSLAELLQEIGGWPADQPIGIYRRHEEGDRPVLVIRHPFMVRFDQA